MTTDTIEVEPIGRLAQKVKGLIAVLERTRSELTQTTEDNLRLSREVEELRDQLATAETSSADLANLRQEREQIRTQVTDMLEQLESISV
jgi:regulator of replication initiation timing